MKLKFIDSAIIIALLTGYFYCVDSAYTGGYLSVFGLDSDVLERNFHQVIYTGFIKGYLTVTRLSLFVFILIFIWNISRLTVATYLRKNISNKRKYRNRKKKLCFPVKKLSRLERVLWKRLLYSFFTIIFLIILIMNLASFENDGAKSAIDAKARIAEGKAMVISISAYKNKLSFIYCGTKTCAGFDMQEQKVVYFPQGVFTVSDPKLKIQTIKFEEKQQSTKQGNLDPTIK
ncbi:hypothetical protein [Photobacterium damselae]|uniref:hypothetical protein n=1 Tax=Photobacterium damselae TaxID=38293 RepID=UPI000E05672D|nr:hypothetical protein [Photobacterium damselae]SUB90628.1 Uncharacterised protein [Photobacterium damselae]